MFGLGSEDVENMPVALKDVLVEEADTAVTDAHGIGRPFAEVLAVKEVVLEFIFGEFLRALTVELREHADRSGVSLLGAFPFTVELKGLDHFVVPVLHHDTSPFEMGFGEA